MTQVKPLTFPPLPAFPNWRSCAKQSNSDPAKPIPHPKMTPIMATKSELIHQRHITRVVKGALAGGLHVTSMRVDRDGAIVLFSKSIEPEAHEEPLLSIQSNEWDEVLKK
jgi:hypothetical protein